MKTIGLIGGVSWVSTQEYYRRINLSVNRLFKGNTSAKIILSSLNFNDILPCQLAHDNEKESRILVDHAITLEKAGAEVILICSNTTNMMAGVVQKHINIPLLNIVEVIADYLLKKKISKVGLMGTKRVMYGSFFKNILNIHNTNTEVVVPPEISGYEVDRIIYQELINDVFKKESVQKLKNCINNFADQNVDAVILGCTELPLAVNQDMVNVLLIDCIQVHIEKALEYVLQ
ncbi:MAG: amino acid racemase [Oligoflexia bacterium]|nr:amino acid racemase [Oligoflexia bacterium]